MRYSLKNTISHFALISLLIALPALSFGQFTDDFSDGNFTENPEWTGQTERFTVNDDYQLQLNDAVENTSYLMTGSALSQDCEWRFFIQLKFSPSANNNALVYLAADQFPEPQNAYYLQFGESGSDDAVELFKIENGTSTSICRGPDGMLASAFALGMRIIQQDGQWQVFADPSGGDNYQLLCEANKNFNFAATQFALFCKYTVSNSTKFYFDNFYAGPVIVDNTPPAIDIFEIIDGNQLSLHFTESLNEAQALNTSNFTINKGIGDAASAAFSDENKMQLLLSWTSSFNDGSSYQLTVKNQQDAAGNIMNDSLINFSLYEAAPFDIVINEIMADPNPVVGLPDAEYLELYNTSEFPVSLGGWSLQIGNSLKEMPAMQIGAQSYLILCKPEFESDFAPYGTTAGLEGLSLANDGKILQLLNAKGNMISFVNYDISWYDDPDKNEGGWSLEQIDPLAPCIGKQNWKASENSLGGTPGTENSVMGSNASSPEINTVSLLDANKLSISFNHLMDEASVTDVNTFEVMPGNILADSIRPAKNDLSNFVLYFAQDFAEGISYKLSVKNSIFDCSGQEIAAGGTFPFELPEAANYHDILITEIMADPSPAVGLPEYEYLELYNRSEKSIQLRNWGLSMGSSSTEIGAYVLEAGQRVILIEEEASSSYKFLENKLIVSSISLSNEGALLTLTNKSGRLIFAVDYSSEWYGSSNKAEGGWSLEMKDTDQPCIQNGNWTASTAPEGGTPGAINSVHQKIDPQEAPEIYSINVLNEGRIEITFNQAMDSASLGQTEIYTLSPEIGHPLSAYPVAPFYQEVELELASELQENKIYTLEINQQNLISCAGMSPAESLVAEFGLPMLPDSGDVLINELLFNPYADGDDYIELYNTSDKILDTKDFAVVYLKDSKSEEDVSFLPSYLLMPGEYVAFTQSPEMVLSQYLTPNPNAVVQAADLPNFGSEYGIAMLTQMSNTSIRYDYFAYNEDMHYPLLRSVDGVSLERVSADISSDQEDNWHSAAESVGFGTPAARNSVRASNPDGNDELEITPELFSPDMDGHDDLLTIAFHLEQAGYMAKIQIFNSSGRLIRNLGGNVMPGTEAEYFWDGISNDGSKANIGIYIVYVELYNPQGDVKQFKEEVTLGGMW